MTLVDDLTPGGARIHRRLRPLAVGEEQHGYTVAALADALAAPSDPLNDVVRGGEDHEPWEPAVNPAKAPAWLLRWLGAVVGAGLSGPRVGQTLEQWAVEAREIIVTRPLWRRGTPMFIREAILKTLDATATIDDVRLLERSGGPWEDTLIISLARTPSQPVTTAVAMAEKPALRKLNVVYTDTPVIAQMTRVINNITVGIDSMSVADVT